MKMSAYRREARTYLKGRYGEAFFVSFVFVFAFAVFRIISAASAYFFGGGTASAAAETVAAVISFFTVTPLITGGLWWFFQTVCGRDNRSILKLYSGFRLNSRAAVLYIMMWLKAFLSLFPSAACFTAAYVFLYGKTGLESNIILFALLQFTMLGLVFLGLFLNALFSMVLSPFIFISHPDMNPFKVIRNSAVLMKGKKLEFLRLISVYLPAMLPVVTIPFVLPRAVMSAAVFARECLEESAEIRRKDKL